MVGLDHEYPTGSRKHFYDDNAVPQFEVAPGPYDRAHIMAGSDLVFQLADWNWRKAGRRIINLTEGGKCEIFEKDDLSNWMK